MKKVRFIKEKKESFWNIKNITLGASVFLWGIIICLFL